MRIYIVLMVLALAASKPAYTQPTQSNNTGPTTTAEPAAATTNPSGGATGAALVPNTSTAVRTPDLGTRMGAGNTAPGLVPNQLVRTGDMLTTKTLANPYGETIVENPGVRSGTLPRIKPDNTRSQTNLGAENTGKLNTNTQIDSGRNRAPVSNPGSAATGTGGTATGGSGGT